MSGKIDLTKLSHEQLMHMVDVRGQALQMHHAADQQLLQMIEAEKLTDQHVAGYVKAKNDILAGLQVAEEKIMAGHTKPPLAN